MHQQIGKYRIDSELASGGFGCVYKAWDPSVGRQVAIKVLTSRSDPGLLARFCQEAAAAGNLHHPNIVTIYEFGDQDGTPFIAMEFLDGRNLQQLIADKTALSLRQKLTILAQVADGLASAHGGGVIHRDIKPSNVMVMPDGAVKIMDFGIARAARQPASRLTEAGDLVGTLFYMAPEQFRNAESDALSDIFSFGIVSYELLTGTHPFLAEDTATLIYRITHEDPAVVSELIADCPAGLESFVARAIAKDREARYQSVKDLRYDLGPILQQVQRRDAGELLARAKSLFASADLAQSQSVIRQIFELDPADSEARRLWKEIEDSEARKRLQAVLSTAREHLRERRFSESVSGFEIAARLSRGDAKIAAELSDAQGKLETSRRVARLLTEAARHMEAHDYAAARQIALSARAIDPISAEAGKIISEAEDAIDRQAAELQFKSELTRARGFLLIKETDRALSILAELRSRQPNDSQVNELRNRALAQQREAGRRREMEASLAKARQLIEARQWPEAHQILVSIPKDLSSTEVDSLLAQTGQRLEEARREEGRRTVRDQVAKLLREERTDDAIAALEASLLEFGDDPESSVLLSQVLERQGSERSLRAQNDRLNEIETLANEGKIVEAVRAAEAMRAEWGEFEKLTALMRSLRPAYEKQVREEAIRKTVESARTMIRDGRLHSARLFLQAAIAKNPENTELLSAAAEAESELERQLSAREVSSALAEAQAMAHRGDFPEAVARVDRALQSLGAHPELISLRQSVVAADGDRQVEQLEGSVQELRQAGRQEEALDRVTALLTRVPGNERVTKLEAELRREIENQRKQASVASTLEEARRLLERNHEEEAVALLRRSMEAYPGQSELIALLRSSEREMFSRRRTEYVERQLALSLKLEEQGQFKQAVEVLNDALQAAPRETRIEEALRRAESAMGGGPIQQAPAAAVVRADGSLFKRATRILRGYFK